MREEATIQYYCVEWVHFSFSLRVEGVSEGERGRGRG